MHVIPALLFGLAYTTLFLLFGLGWLRGGNGAWRWKQAKDEVDLNAPLFGVMAFVFLLSAIWFWWSFACGGQGSPTQRTVSRLIHEFPLVVLFVLIAAVRKPWGHDR